MAACRKRIEHMNPCLFQFTQTKQQQNTAKTTEILTDAENPKKNSLDSFVILIVALFRGCVHDIQYEASRSNTKKNVQHTLVFWKTHAMRTYISFVLIDWTIFIISFQLCDAFALHFIQCAQNKLTIQYLLCTKIDKKPNDFECSNESYARLYTSPQSTDDKKGLNTVLTHSLSSSLTF